MPLLSYGVKLPPYPVEGISRNFAELRICISGAVALEWIYLCIWWSGTACLHSGQELTVYQVVKNYLCICGQGTANVSCGVVVFVYLMEWMDLSVFLYLLECCSCL
jgi:hypothetical protein